MLRDAGLDVEVYLRLLRERAGELLAHDGGGAYPVSVAASWAVAFDRLAADDPAALDLLTLVAWCGPEPVPLNLLTDHPDVLPDPAGRHRRATRSRWRGARRSCTGGRWPPSTPHSIQRAPGAGRAAARPHPRRASRPRRAGRRWWSGCCTQALPADVWNNPAVWPRWQQLLPHVLAAVDPDRRLDDVPDELSWLLDCAARYRLTRGEARAALPLFQRAHASRPGPARRRPPRHPRLGQQPRPRPARAGSSTSRPATWTRTPSPAAGGSSATTTPTPSRSANNLAVDLRGLGEYQQARDLDEDTLTRRRRVLGDDHPDTLTSASNLAVDLCALGEYQQARDLDEDTLTRRRRVLGDDHPDTLSSANNLAVDLRGLGEYQQARDLDEDTLTRRRRVLGDDHPDTLTSANNLAADLRALGEYQQARDLDEDTLTRHRRVLGDDHPDTLASANNLAIDLRALGEHQRARELDEDTLARKQRRQGSDSRRPGEGSP